MPKQNHLTGGKKSSKKNSSLRGKRFLGKEKPSRDSESEGNTTSEMRKILDFDDNKSHRGTEQPMPTPQTPMPPQPMPTPQTPMPPQPMPTPQIPMPQMPMPQMPMPMPQMPMPMTGMNNFDASMVETLAPMSNLGNLSKLNPNQMNGLSALPQYSELEPFNGMMQRQMPMQMPMQQPMGGLSNLAQLGRMF